MFSLCVLRGTGDTIAGFVRLPVAVASEDIILQEHPPAGEALAAIAEAGLRRGEGAELDIESERFFGDAARDFGPGEDRGDCAGENEAVFERRVKQRLLAHAIAREENRARSVARVVDGEGEHAQEL